jgi:hypothetical protein
MLKGQADIFMNENNVDISSDNIFSEINAEIELIIFE